MFSRLISNLRKLALSSGTFWIPRLSGKPSNQSSDALDRVSHRDLAPLETYTALFVPHYHQRPAPPPQYRPSALALRKRSRKQLSPRTKFRSLLTVIP